MKHYLDSNHCNGNNEICNYLNIFLDCKLYTECPHFISDSSTLRYKNIDFFKDCFFKKKNLGRVIYIGPNYTINDSIYNFDTLIVNKIPPFEIKSFRFVVLILNNGWTLKNNTLISEWEKNNDNSIIISPLKINDRILPHKVFDFMPQFPFQSSLMGLQRSLFILYQLYNYQTMNVCGFDFNLTTKSYMKWYPSLMKEHFGSFDRGVVLSSCVHDLLLNFLFAKRIASHDQRICGDILHYLKLTPEDVVCRFQHVRAF